MQRSSRGHRPFRLQNRAANVAGPTGSVTILVRGLCSQRRSSSLARHRGAAPQCHQRRRRVSKAITPATRLREDSISNAKASAPGDGLPGFPLGGPVISCVGRDHNLTSAAQRPRFLSTSGVPPVGASRVFLCLQRSRTRLPNPYTSRVLPLVESNKTSNSLRGPTDSSCKDTPRKGEAHHSPTTFP